jgi:hypothetical protein
MRRIFLYAFIAFAVICVLFLGGKKMFAQSGVAPSMITKAVDERQLVTLRGNVHPFARAEYDQGEAPSTMAMNHMLLVLKRSPEQEAALENLIQQQADKNSPNYEKYLTPAQFGQQFGASDQDITTISTWLGSHGFQVASPSAGRDMIEFSGTSGEVEEAFHTQIHHFVVNGENHFANVSDPQIPAALAPMVVGVNRLNDFMPKAMHHKLAPMKMTLPGRKITPAVTPNYTFTTISCYTNVNDCYGVTPADLASIYSLPSLTNSATNGTGIHIAIISDSDIRQTDDDQFRTLMGFSTQTVNQIVPPGLTDPGIQSCTVNSDEDEAILDAEWAGGTAPGATIDLIEAPSAPADTCNGASTSGETGLPTGYTSGFGGDYAAYYAINTLNDPILTDSYGECELGLGASGNTFYNALWQQANVQGIIVLSATGDNGSAGCDNPSSGNPASDGLAVNGAASTPYNVAVGGTDFDYNSASGAATYWNSTNSTTTISSAKGPIPEVVYNATCTNPLFFSLVGQSTALNSCNSVAASNDALIGTEGGGGGESSCISANGGAVPADCTGGYAKPSWQTGAGVPSDSVRDIPDVSLFAGDGNGPSVTFYIVCEEDGINDIGQCSLTPTTSGTNVTLFFVPEGGTSVSAQAFAGIVADLEQAKGGKRYSSVAFNTQLYTVSSSQSAASCNGSSTTQPASTCAIRDITSGTNSMPCELSVSPNCGNSDTSNLLPVGSPRFTFHWTPWEVALAVSVLLAASLLLLMAGERRRWSTALALFLLAAVFGVVSCGGGSGSSGGTVTQGSGNTIGVLSGYNAGTAYDRATGVGSVNATALISAFK